MGQSSIGRAEAGDIEAEPIALIAAAAAGDLTAFETLYRQFAPRIYGLCLRLTGQREAAEDCTQESFVAAWRALGRFEKRSRFSTWLQRIAIRTVLSRRRGLRFSRRGRRARRRSSRSSRHRTAPAIDLERAIAACPRAHATCWCSSAFTVTATPRRPAPGGGGRYLQGSVAPCARFAGRGARIGGRMKDRLESLDEGLAKLSRDIVPPRNLWPAIEREIERGRATPHGARLCGRCGRDLLCRCRSPGRCCTVARWTNAAARYGR